MNKYTYEDYRKAIDEANKILMDNLGLKYNGMRLNCYETSDEYIKLELKILTPEFNTIPYEGQQDIVTMLSD